MSGAVVLGAWALALGVVAAPLAGLPEPDLRQPGTLDRLSLVVGLALVAASTPRSWSARLAGPRKGYPATGPAATGPAAAALATVVLFLPIAAVAQELDVQSGRERSPLFAALAATFAFALAWSSERARRDERVAARYGLAWALLLALPAVAASVFSSTPLAVPGFAGGAFAWSPVVWSVGPREAALALLPAASIAVLVGLVAGRAASREA